MYSQGLIRGLRVGGVKHIEVIHIFVKSLSFCTSTKLQAYSILYVKPTGAFKTKSSRRAVRALSELIYFMIEPELKLLTWQT